MSGSRISEYYFGRVRPYTPIAGFNDDFSTHFHSSADLTPATTLVLSDGNKALCKIELTGECEVGYFPETNFKRTFPIVKVTKLDPAPEIFIYRTRGKPLKLNHLEEVTLPVTAGKFLELKPGQQEQGVLVITEIVTEGEALHKVSVIIGGNSITASIVEPKS